MNEIYELNSFLSWKESLETTIFNDITHYDVMGYYKYLKESELLEYYLKYIKHD